MLVEPVRLYPTSDWQKETIADAIFRVWQSGIYIGGPEVIDFERAWAEYCGAEHCIAVSSGFAALQLIVKALDRASVCYSTLTCLPTPLAIEEGGSNAFPISPEPSNYLLKPTQLQWGAVNVAVNLYGIIDPLLDQAHCVLVEDAAQAHGALYKFCRRSHSTTAASWSFYPTKNLGAMGDAGAVTTNDGNLAEKIRGLREYKSDRGINARMDPLQAAILMAKLPMLDSQNLRRAANAELYKERLKDLPIEMLSDNVITNWHQFPIRVERGRDLLKARLESKGIRTQVHYDRPALLPGTRASTSWESQWCHRVLSLPIGPHLGEKEINYVSEVICGYFD